MHGEGNNDASRWASGSLIYHPISSVSLTLTWSEAESI
jgi:hypothetical protein